MSAPARRRAAPRSAAEQLARAGWLDLLEDIHGGLCHDLNSRISSVDGLLQILEMQAADAAQTLAYLGPEAERLAELGGMFASLAGRLDAAPEAFEPVEMLATARALLGRHRKLSALEVRLPDSSPIPPVRACRPRLLRVLLVLLGRAGAAARAAGHGSIAVELAGRGGSVELRVRVPGEGGTSALEGALAGAEDPLAELLALDGGELLVEEGALGLSLPALGAS